MSKKSVYCIAASRTQAEFIADGLKDAGFSSGEISVVLPESGGHRMGSNGHHDGSREGGLKEAEQTGWLGWVASGGWRVVSGPKSLLASGPIAAALGGSAQGNEPIGLAEVLADMGVPELEARRCERKVRLGGVLLCVHAHSEQASAQAREVFEDAYAEEIGIAVESDTHKQAVHHH